MAAPVYATIADMEALGIAADALSAIDPDVKNRILSAMSRKIDTALRSQFVLPLLNWGDDVRDVCVQLATYRCLAGRGFNPEGMDKNIIDNYDRAIKELENWASNRGASPDVVDSSPTALEGVPSAGNTVASAPSRGWSVAGLDPRFPSDTSAPFTGGRR